MFNLSRLFIVALAALTAQHSDASEQACTAVGYARIKPPQYPPSAIFTRASGKTILLLTVAPDGLPRDISVEVSSGNAELDAAAKEQVALWQFIPSRCSGKAISSQVRVPVSFELTDDVLKAVWELSTDSVEMERPSVQEELMFLHTRTNLKRTASADSETFIDDDKMVLWVVSQAKDGATGIMRVRLESNSNVYRSLYATLCGGSAEWCAKFIELETARIRASGPPPPPPLPVASRPDR